MNLEAKGACAVTGSATHEAVIPGDANGSGYGRPDDRLGVEPGISRLRVWC
jgi:hypothetical protein